MDLGIRAAVFRSGIEQVTTIMWWRCQKEKKLVCEVRTADGRQRKTSLCSEVLKILTDHLNSL